MKKILVGFAALSLMFSGAASAITDPAWSFGNVSLNKLDWSGGTQERASHLKDFTFIELEGGAGYAGGDVYGFLDIEDFSNYSSAEDVKLSGKLVTKFYTPVEKVSVYHQTFFVASKDFDTVDTVLGLAYSANVGDVRFTPFVGAQYSSHDADWQSNFSGMNGYMAGWTAMYDFTVGQEKFSVTNWHEVTFGRNHEYLKTASEAKELGHNGALSLWWHPTRHLTTGVQWRYADNKIGSNGNVNAAIYTIKYNF